MHPRSSPSTRWLASGVIFIFALTAIVARCSVGGANEPSFDMGFDVHGASNSRCVVTLQQGNATLEFDVDPPAPPVADTSLAPHGPATSCPAWGDAGVASLATSPQGASANVVRSSTMLCIASQDRQLMSTFGYNLNSPGDCPVQVTLTCGGVVLYDHVPGKACQWLG